MPTAAAITAFVCVAVLMGLGNTVGYHRLLTHRSFETVRPLRWALTLLGASYSGSPIMWVGIHRLHHMKSDGEGDPHSPRDGLFWSHCGWLIGTHAPVLCGLYALSGFGQQVSILWHDIQRLRGHNPPTWRELCHDLMEDPLLRLLDAPFVMTAYFVLQLVLAWVVAGWLGITLLWALHLWLTNTSWAVNSLCHHPAVGVRHWQTSENSRDVWWLALATFGESHHNSHHRYPRSARHALKGGFDASWLLIDALQRLGLAWKVWLPKAYR